MKRSEKILKKSGPKKTNPNFEHQIIKNTTLLEYLIDKDIPNLRKLILMILVAFFGLILKSLLGG